MKITGNDDILKYINDPKVNRFEEKESKATTGGVPAQEQRDHTVVNISQRSKEIQMAQQAMESQPDVRDDKIRDIAERVKNGTYQIDYGKTGEKMVATFIDELA
jgi:negative regulator of flagellin synthesis FlgM